MTLKNHNKNNTYDIDTYVMRGTIEMTQKEYAKVFTFLKKKYNIAVKNCNTYIRDSLAHIRIDTPFVFSLGVCATKLLVKKFGLKGYRDQNYGIKII